MAKKNPVIEIKGIDLKIDSSVQKICEAYNASSGSTRSVLYILMLINVLSFVAVLNTHRGNWLSSRINSKQDSISKYEKAQIKLISAHKKDSLKTNYDNKEWAKYDTAYTFKNKKFSDQLNRDVTERNNLINGKIGNSETVRVPIMGNSFDIDDLAIVSGISFITLLTILRLTLRREKNNLRLSLHAITERYSGKDGEFLTLASEIAKRESQKDDFVFEAINLTRRKHHYNYLSMNEIFNLPCIHVSGNNLRTTVTGKIVVYYLFYFPCIIYLFVFLNDLSTWYEGFQVSRWHTIILYAFSYFFLTLIGLLCKACNKQKLVIDGLFFEFQRYGTYTYVAVDNLEPKLTKWELLVYPFILLRKLILISWRNIPKSKYYLTYLALSFLCIFCYVFLFEMENTLLNEYYFFCLLPVLTLYFLLKAFNKGKFPIIPFLIFFVIYFGFEFSKEARLSDILTYINKLKLNIGKLMTHGAHSIAHFTTCICGFALLIIFEGIKLIRKRMKATGLTAQTLK